MTEQTVLTAALVPNRSRNNFLPRQFGMAAMMAVENRIYNYAAKLLPGYTGGFWEFVILSNGGGYLRPTGVETFDTRPVENITYGEATLSADAAGLALTILAVNHEMVYAQDRPRTMEFLSNSWDRLMDFARVHPEAAALNSLLD